MTYHPASRHRRWPRSWSLLAVAAIAVSVVTPATVARAADFTALEIFTPEGALRAGTPIAPCGDRACKLAKYDNARFPAGMPAPSLESRVIMGVVTDVVRNRGGIVQWKIGTGARSQWVFASSETRSDNNPGRGSLVKVIAARTTRFVRRPLIAERVTNRQPGQRFPTKGAGAPEIERGFLWTGTVDETAADSWTLSDGDETVTFTIITDPEAPTEIDPATLGAGDRVTVQFISGAPAG